MQDPVHGRAHGVWGMLRGPRRWEPREVFEQERLRAGRDLEAVAGVTWEWPGWGAVTWYHLD